MREFVLIDAFCGAGGAGKGYGEVEWEGCRFRIVGVDNQPQPRYPFEFHQADALEFLLDFLGDGHTIHAVHASPPCQRDTRAKVLRGRPRKHPDLITPTRNALQTLGVPYVIENVIGARLNNPVQLCGSAFGLGAAGLQLRRHRLFETNWPLATPGCAHVLPSLPVFGHSGNADFRKRFGRDVTIKEKHEAMGIDWMNRNELAEAIPPAFTRYIGLELLKLLAHHSEAAA